MVFTLDSIENGHTFSVRCGSMFQRCSAVAVNALEFSATEEALSGVWKVLSYRDQHFRATKGNKSCSNKSRYSICHVCVCTLTNMRFLWDKTYRHYTWRCSKPFWGPKKASVFFKHALKPVLEKGFLKVFPKRKVATKLLQTMRDRNVLKSSPWTLYASFLGFPFYISASVENCWDFRNCALST